MSHNGRLAQPNTAFNEIPVAKPLNAKDIESQSLLGADLQNEWGSAEAMEKVLRRGFLKKVYGLLSIQMLVTVGFVAMFMFDDKVKSYTQQNQWVLITAFVAYLFSAFAIICCGDLRRKHPHGLILLAIVTLSMSTLVGVISATYDAQAVIIAASLTTGATLGLSLYACFTKRDFTTMGGPLCSLFLVLFMSAFLFMWLPVSDGVSNTMNIVYGSVGAFVMCLFIVYDTQLMLGGKHKYAISMDEYVFAALNLYLDIINLFLYLLRIVGGNGRR